MSPLRYFVSEKWLSRGLSWLMFLVISTIMKQNVVVLKEHNFNSLSNEISSFSFPSLQSLQWEATSPIHSTSRRASFRRPNASNRHNNTNIVTSLVQDSMSRQFSWYKACIKEHGKPKRKKNAVPRACPQSMGDDDAINGNPLRDHGCRPTEAVELQVLPHGKWRLRALDGDGNFKSIGGDEFYVVYTDDETTISTAQSNQTTAPTAVAIVDDNNDGTYSLDFVTVLPFGANTTVSAISAVDGSATTFTGSGRIEVYLQHTCFIGTMHQPSKDGWKTGGAMNVVATFDNIERPSMDSWQDRLKERGGVIRNPIGSNNITPSSAASITISSLSKFDKTIFFGDSLMVQMILTYTQPLEWFYPSKTTTLRNIDMSITMTSLEVVKEKLHELHGSMLQRNGNMAMVIGSAAWDLLHPFEVEDATFELHLQACRALVEHIRSKYPSVTLLWRLPTAILVHIAQESCFALETKKNGMMMFNNPCVDILRYASSTRVDYLYKSQLQLMLEELHVPVIDLYELSYLSAHALRQGDSMHFNIDWNREILAEYIYPEVKEAILRGDAKR